MKPIFLDMVWPAIFVSTTFYKFWYLVIGTIIIETFVIKLFLKFNWKMSIIASLVGNCISGFIGTFIMIWAMLFWHFVADNFVPNGTFGTTNWVATFVLMCLGSVFLETLAIKILYKEKIKKLFLPMLTGNFLSYLFIAYSMITNSNANPAEKSIQTIKYLPNKQNFILLNKSKLFIDTSIIKISIDKNGKRMNDSKSPGYYLVVPQKVIFIFLGKRSLITNIYKIWMIFQQLFASVRQRFMTRLKFMAAAAIITLIRSPNIPFRKLRHNL